MSDLTEMPYIVWAWRHFSLFADFHETLRDAVSASNFAENNGDQATMCIEGPDGIVPNSEIEEAEKSLLVEARSASQAVTHMVWLESPNGGETVDVAACTSAEEAERIAQELRKRFGNRVSIAL